MTAAGAKGQVETLELSRGERTVARRASEIRATVPHLELSVLADVRRALAGGGQDGLSFAALLVRASALALREVPRANGSYRGDVVDVYSRVNIGVTLSEEDLHVIPTVFDADQKSATEIDEELHDLRERARRGELRPPELAGATFTVFDAGEHGLHATSPLVISPQAAALAAGAAYEGAGTRLRSARGGTNMTQEDVDAPSLTMLTLACDHRILYGAMAARFLNSIRTHLEQGAP